MNQPTERITINPNVCNGRPTIRNMRFTVAQLPLFVVVFHHRQVVRGLPKDDRVLKMKGHL